MAFLEAQGLSKTYRNAEVPVSVFENLTMSVRSGEMLAVVGPSGIGKSTLLHLLGGLDRPDRGKIVVADRELTTMTNDELARWRNRSVGFVFQFHHLLPEFSAVENVAMPGWIDEPSGLPRRRADRQPRSRNQRASLRSDARMSQEERTDLGHRHAQPGARESL